jgi:phospholipase C
MAIDRRQFLRGALASAGAAYLTSQTAPTLFAQASGCTLTNPAASGIEHIVVVMMENRSFDHLFGWFPGADGKQAGLTYYDSAGVAHNTYPLAPDYTGCGHPDPTHSYDGGRVEYDNGAMDGFLRAGRNDVYCIGYYGAADQPFLSALASNYTVADRYFPSILAGTFPNRIFAHAAQTDRLYNTAAPCTLPTIWDRLAAAGVSGLYYFSNLPFLGLWGAKYAAITRPYAEFLADAAYGTLPAVSFVDPSFTTIDDGTGTDDHPHDNIQRGDAFLAQTFQAVASGPLWSSTVFIINFDEWGGFFEHVVPPRAIAPNNVDPDLVRHKALLGIRVPAIIASPFSKGDPNAPRVVGSTTGMVFDHTSVLKLIEWRWGLDPLTARDASNDINNLACVLNFTSPDATVPVLPQPAMPEPVPCLSDPGGLTD